MWQGSNYFGTAVAVNFSLSAGLSHFEKKIIFMSVGHFEKFQPAGFMLLQKRTVLKTQKIKASSLCLSGDNDQVSMI